MHNDKAENISFFIVTEAKDGVKWLLRLADIEDGTLKLPEHNEEDPEDKFGNRINFRWQNGPDTIGTFGVWKWYTVPNNKNPDNDYYRTSYADTFPIIEVVAIHGVSGIDSVLDCVKEGISLQPASSRVLFYPKIRRSSFYEGVLCTLNDLTIKDGKTVLAESVQSLPIYSLRAKDMLELGGKIFYSSLDCGEPLRKIPLKSHTEIICKLITRRLSWQTAKSLGITKNTWRNVLEFISTGSTESILQEVITTLGCDEAAAQTYINEFLDRADCYINAEDYDSGFIAKLLDNHPALMKKCEDLAAENFRKTHQDEVDQAQESLKALSSEIEGKNDELSAANLAVSLAQQKLSALTTSIQEHEHIADRVAEHVRKRIDSARSDAAAFIAEMAFTAPAPVPARAKALTPGKNLPAEKLASLIDWKGAVDILREELNEAGVSQQYSLPFAAFMCAACVNTMPLLLAGPNAQDIADAFAATLSGHTAGVIDCSGQYYPEIAREIDEASDEVFAVKNALRSEWVAHIPDLHRHGKYFFVVHPFAEDLLIEPKSLFTYALPVFTELICDSVPSRDFAGATKAQDFAQFTHGTAAHIPDTPLVRAGITTFTRSRIRSVLADFHILHNQDDNLDRLFILFPYAYIAGHVSLVLEKISDERLRNELAAFAGEEDAQA